MTESHYSYTTYADPETARTFDDRRFGGPIGELIASTQARVLANLIGTIRDRVVLDVGTGTGRAALLLARGGAHVTAIDASAEMLAVARRRAAAEGVPVRFLVGDAHALEFPDRAFDVAVCLRVIMHAPEWRRCIGELCRVADRLVVVDYPSAHSVAAIESAVRRVAHTLGWKTEPYRVFTHRTIAEAFARHGFRIRSMHRQFVLPIAFHKAIGSLRFTRAIEGLLDRAGLLGWFGSPVTLVAERCASS
ncbi:MAG TPA: methyltransferase domain-containing protein [Vicinamibacterales bacterium]|nr:methyltransferase domain-containing protein [Vicinamibacterales bacterium]